MLLFSVVFVRGSSGLLSNVDGIGCVELWRTRVRLGWFGMYVDLDVLCVHVRFVFYSEFVITS